jgi:membrane-associated protease RseP (regulator of RpoE activity)
MKARWLVFLLASITIIPLASANRLRAAGAPPPAAAVKGPAVTYAVPYRLTNVLHVLVRVKINGKGPFNFIIDTGAPLVFVSKETGKRLGLKPGKGDWTSLDRLEIEGGLSLHKVKARLETPFQLEGMNAMGLAGAEIHGILGYTLLARFRLDFDFTRDRLRWTPLHFDPPPPQPLGKGPAPPSLGAMAFLVKVMSFLVGKVPAPEVAPRGYLGIELADAGGAVTVKAVLAGGPAARAGLRPGDRIDQVLGKAVKTAAEVHRRTARITAGQVVRLRIRRGHETREVAVTAGEGL